MVHKLLGFNVSSSVDSCESERSCSFELVDLSMSTAAFGRARPLVPPLGLAEGPRCGDTGEGLASR